MHLVSDVVTAADYEGAVELFFTRGWTDGLPVVWDTFEEAARQQARLQGVPDLELVVIPHRRGGETAEDQVRKAEAALGAVAARLVQGA
jgi:hypothetical protein